MEWFTQLLIALNYHTARYYILGKREILHFLILKKTAIHTFVVLIMWVLINFSRVWGIFLNNCQRLNMTWHVQVFFSHKKLIENVEDVSILLPILPLLCKILTTFKLDRFGWRQPSSDKSASRNLWSPGGRDDLMLMGNEN